MTIIISGHEQGLLDGSATLLKRNDRLSGDTLAEGEQIVTNVANGNLVVQERDSVLIGQGDELQLVRTYNSRAQFSGPSNGQGVGQDFWRFFFEVALDKSSEHFANGESTEVYDVKYGDGSVFRFVFDAKSGDWVSTDGAGSFETLKVNKSNNSGNAPAFVLTRADRTRYEFDSSRNLTAMVDRNGVRTSFVRSGGRLAKIVDASGRAFSLVYEGNRIVQVLDEKNVRLVSYQYDVGSSGSGSGGSGQLVAVTDRLGLVTRYTYNADGSLARIDLPNQQVIGGVTQTFAARSWSFKYVSAPVAGSNPKASAPVLAELIDASGGRTTFDYAFQFSATMAADDRDAKFRLNGKGNFFTGGTTQVVNALGNARATSNAAEYVAWRKDNGYYATYDATAVANNASLKAQYEAIRAAHSLRYTYDADGYLTQVIDQVGVRTRYTYDLNDNLTSVKTDLASAPSVAASTASAPANTAAARVAASSLTTTAALAPSPSLAQNVTYTYDGSGNLAQAIDGDGNKTLYTYTATNQLASMTAAMGDALATRDDLVAGDGYYRAKRLTLGLSLPNAAAATLTAAQQAAIRALYTTTYSYDARDNLITRLDPGGDRTDFQYDAAGNLTQKIVYLDAADRVTPSKQHVTGYAYDAFGNNVSIVDALGSTTTRTFDSFGNLLTETDARGGVTVNTYDADNRLTSTRDPLGNLTSYTYDAVGNRIGITDANGHALTQIFDLNNRLIATLDPAIAGAAQDRRTGYTYDVSGNRTSVTDANGNTTTYTYDAANRLIDVASASVLDANGNPVVYHERYTYDALGNVLTLTDNNGNVTTYTYSLGGLLKSFTDAVGNVTEYLYDANRQQVQLTIGAQLAAGQRRVLKFDYDEEDQVIGQTDALGSRQLYTYDAIGNQLSVTDANGGRTDFTYDKNNRLLTETRPSVTDPITGLPTRYTISYQYDANGNEVAVTDENGRTTTTTFDKNNRQVMVTDGAGTKTVYFWDSRDNQTQVAVGVDAHVDANGNIVIDNTTQASITSFSFNEFNETVAATDGVGNALVSSDAVLYQNMRVALGFAALTASLTAANKADLLNRYTERYEYDRVGNRTRVTDHLGRVSTVVYDALNRVQQRTEALGTLEERTTAMRYDGNANLVKLTDALGRVTRYAYDSVSRLTDETDARGIVTHHVYDHVGNILEDTEAFGTANARTTRYVYDLGDRQTQEIDPEGNTKRYEYDAIGKRLKEIDGRGGTTEYVYDALNRNIRIIDPLGFVTRMEYDAVGNRITTIDANGGIERLQYDGANRNIQTTDAQGRVTRYEYDRQDNLIRQTTAFGLPEAQITTYVYDAEDNLRQITDAAGNVTSKDFDQVYNETRHIDSRGTTTTAFDALNRMLRVTDALGGVTIYSYDKEDNQLTETDPLGRTRSFQWDAVDRMIVQTDALGVETRYAYDEVGNQVSITRAANTPTPSTTIFTYDRNDRLLSQTSPLGNKLTYAYDANGNVLSTTDALGRITRYTYDANDQVSTITDPLGGVTRYVYDGRGNRVQVIDARGKAQTTYFNKEDEVILTVDAEGFAIANTYDGNGNLVSSTQYMTRLSGPILPTSLPTLTASAADRKISVVYDKLNREIQRTDALGGISKKTYDAVGNLASQTDELGRITTYAYDANDRLTSKTNPLAGVRRFTYDAMGNRLTDTDELGRVTRYTYDAEDRVLTETDPLLGVKRYSYDAVGNTLTETDPLGRVTAYAYDLEDRLIRETDALGGVTAYTYDAVGNRLSVTDPLGRVTQFAYDGNDRRIRQADALNGVSTVTYDAVGNQISQTNERGFTTTFAYDGNNRLMQQTDALGGVRSFTYDAAGNQLAQIDELGRTTRFTYDANDRLIKKTNPLLKDRIYTYDKVGNLLTETDELLRKTTFAYDANYRLTSQTNALNGVRRFTYDAVGNKLTETNENGRRTSYAYDANDRLIRETNALNGVKTYTYDAAGNRLTETDEKTQRTSFAYDALNRLTTTTNALGGKRTFAYDAVGNRTKDTDENGNVTTATYDANNRLLSETNAVGGVRKYTYDAIGNQLSSTDERGNVTRLEYDANDRLIKQTDPLGGIRAFGYDAVGNKLTEKDENNHITSFAYDALDRLTRQTSPIGGVKSYAYDAVGNKIGETDENNRTVTYQYDVLDRMVAQTNARLQTTRFSYDAVGNNIQVENPLGQRLTNYFDALNRLDLSVDADGVVMQSVFDAVSNPTQRIVRAKRITAVISTTTRPTIATDAADQITKFTYDALNRLATSTDAEGNIASRTYDAVGNLLTETDPLGKVTRYAYDANDRILSETNALNQIKRFSYDAAGNTLTETDAAGKVTTYTYDANNRVLTERNPLNGTRTLTYDAVGNLLSELDETGRITTMAYDSNDRKVEERDAAGGVRRFFYDLAGNLVADIDASGRGRTYTYNEVNLVATEFDGIGTKTYTYDANNNLTAIQDGVGVVTRKTYDRRSQVVSDVDGLGKATTYVYDTAGNRVQIVDPLGRSTLYYFDRDNRVTLMVDPLGYATSTTYDKNGNILKLTVHATPITGTLTPAVRPTVVASAEDRVTTYTYDALDRLLTETDPRGALVTYGYDTAGNQISRAQARSAAADVAQVRDYYDANHQRIASLSAQGTLTTFGYDAAGRETLRIEYLGKYTAPADGVTPPVPLATDIGRRTATTYDVAGRKDTEAGPTGLVTRFEYDPAGREVTRIEGFGTPQARVTSTGYDAAGNVTDTMDAAGTATHFVLDAIGRVVEKHVAFGTLEARVTRYEYDANDRVKAEINALGIRTEFTYDDNGHLTLRKTAVGIVGQERSERFIYDAAGFLIEQINGAGERTTFEYDGAGNRTKITVAPGTTAQRVLLYRYDGNNNLIEETDGAGVMTRYVYDELGNKTQTIQAANKPGFERTTKFSYDTDSRLTQVTDPMGGVTRYEYDAVGNQKKITDPNGVVTLNEFDALGRVVSSTSGVGGPHGGVRVVNTYDLFGNIVSTTQSFADGSDARTTQYEYDALNRQTAVIDGEGFRTEFSYDRFGNQTRIVRGAYQALGTPGYDPAKAARVRVQTTDFSYDKLDRLILTVDGVGNRVTSSYDARGNRLTQTTSDGTAQAATVTFSYDLADRVTQKLTPTGGRTRLSYDAAGNQTVIETLQSVNGTGETLQLQTFTFDGNGRVLTETDAMGAVTRHELDFYGNELALIAAAGTPDERVARHAFDANGNKIADIDAAGSQVTYVRDAAGNKVREIDPRGRSTYFYYDGLNQQIAELDAEGFLTTFTRDAGGNIVETRVYSQRYAGGGATPPTPNLADVPRIVLTEVDRAGNSFRRVETDGITQIYERDSDGLLLKQTTLPASNLLFLTNNPAPRIQTFDYDASGRLTRYVNVDGVEETYQYDAANNKVLERTHNPNSLSGGRIDPDRVTTYGYDLDNRLTRQTFDNGGVLDTQSLAYDRAGNVVQKTDANGNVTISKYDLDNRLIEVDAPEDAILRYGYDRVGNQTSVTDARGNTTDFVYDQANRVIVEIRPQVATFPTGLRRPVISRMYDAAGNQVQLIDANGFKTTSYYDGDNNLVAEINADNVLRTYTYDATATLTSVSLYMTRLPASAHDPIAPPAIPAGEVRTITTLYDAAGRVVEKDYPQIEVTRVVGTDTNNPVELPAAQLIQPREINRYDGFGNLVESIDKNGNRSLAYFDTRGRVIAAVDAAGYLSETDYDDQGNVVEQRRYRTALNMGTLNPAAKPIAPLADADIVTRTYDAANRLIEELSSAVKIGENAGVDVLERVRTRYAYDNNGNQTSKTFAAGTPDAVTEYYYYDGANRQIGVVTGGRTLNTFAYDGAGNTVSQTRFYNRVPIAVTLPSSFAALLASVVPDPTRDETTLSDYNSLNRVIHQTDVMAGAGNNIERFIDYDAAGNVTRRVDAQGNVTTITYDGMGHIVSTATPDGGQTITEYDAAGLKVRSFAGAALNVPPSVPTSVGASFANGALNISFTQPDVGTRSWVVWNVVPRSIPPGSAPDQVYPNKSSAVGTVDSRVSIPSNDAIRRATTVYLRVVSENSLGHLSWSEEHQVGMPTLATDLITQRSGNDLLVRVRFNKPPQNPFVAISGTSTSFTLIAQADGSYLATIPNGGQGVGGPLDIFYSAGPDEPQGSYQTASVPPGIAPPKLIAPGVYAIPVPTIDGQALGNAQAVVVNGNLVATSALDNAAVQSGQQVQFNAPVANVPYEIYFGNSVTAGDHTTRIARNALNVIDVAWTPGAGELPLMASPPKLVFSLGAAGGPVNMVQQANGTWTAQIPTDISGAYNIEIRYTHRLTGREVIAEFKRSGILGLPVSVTFTGRSLELLASASDTSLAFGNPARYVGVTAVPQLAFVAVPVVIPDSITASSGIGSLVRDSALLRNYFTEIRYNALGYKVASNEDDGVWRTYGVDANGNTLATRLFGTQADETAFLAGQPGHAPIVSYAAYDARDKQVASFSALANVAGQATTARRVTRFSYDYDNRKLTQLDPGDTVATRYRYDGVGNLVSVTDPLNQVTRSIYDRRGNMTRAIDAKGGVTLQTYDADDNVTSETDALNRRTTYAYDAFKRVVSSTDALNHTRAVGYDQHDRMTSFTNALGFVTRRFYDKRDNEIWLQDANGHWFGKAYDSMGRLTHEYSFVSNSPTSLADAQAALVPGNVRFASLVDKATTYDVFGNAVRTIDPMGRQSRFAYGAFGRQIGSTNGEGLSSTEEYDRFGRKVRERNNQGQDIVRSYDDANLLIKVDDKATKTTTDYTYYLSGARASEVVNTTAPSTQTLRSAQYSYDQLERVTRWTDSGKSLNYQFDANGNISRIFDDQGSVNTRYSYDAANELINRTSIRVGSDTYTYDAAGNQVTDNGRVLTYDAENRFLSGPTQQRQYDNVGNVVQTATLENGVNISSSRYFYSDNNLQIRSSSGGSFTDYNYDKSGRLLSRFDQGAGASYTYNYNLFGKEARVDAVGQAGASSSASFYNANGELTRFLTTTSGVTSGHDFAYDSNGHIVLKDGTRRFYYINDNLVGDDGEIAQGQYDLNQVIDEDFPAVTPQTYVAQGGESLQSLAASFYGNPSLWYVIADANGLTGSESLHAGMQLTIPNTTRIGNITSETHVLYREGNIIGSTLPNLPEPPPAAASPDNTCKIAAAITLVILVAILALALTIVTVGLAAPAAAAALGVAATSAVGIIVGIAVGAAIGAGIAFAASVITQGILVGFELQKEFDWKQVAADTVAGAFGGAVAGLGTVIEAGLVASKLTRLAVVVASAALEAAGEAARQAINNDGHIDTPWMIGAAAAGGAFGGLITRATRVVRTVGEAGETTFKLLKKAPAGTIIKGVKGGRTVTVVAKDGQRFVLRSANVKLVKTAAGELRIVRRVGNTVPRAEKVRQALLKTFGIGRTVSKGKDGYKVVKSFELVRVVDNAFDSTRSIYKEVLKDTRVLRNTLQKGGKLVLDDSTKLKLIGDEVKTVQRISSQFTRGQRVARTLGVGQFATRTVSKLGNGQKLVQGFRQVADAAGVLSEQRGLFKVTRDRLLEGKSLVRDARTKLRLIDDEIKTVRRISDQYTRLQRLQRFLKLGEFKVGGTVNKFAALKNVRTGFELQPSKVLKGVLEEAPAIKTVPREALLAGKSVKLDKQIKFLKVGDDIVSIRRISDQYTTLQRVQRRLGRAFDIGEYAAKRTVKKLNIGEKKVAYWEQVKTAAGFLEEQRVTRYVNREALNKGKSIVRSDRIKLRIIDGKIERLRRISSQYTPLERVQRRVGEFFEIGNYARSRSFGKSATTKLVNTLDLVPTGKRGFLKEVYQTGQQIPRLSAQNLAKRQLAAAAVRQFASAAAEAIPVGGKKFAVALNNFIGNLPVLKAFDLAALFGTAGNKATVGRGIVGTVGNLAAEFVGEAIFGVYRPQEHHKPGNLKYLLQTGLTFAKSLAAYHSGGDSSADTPETASARRSFAEAVGIPTLNVLLNGKGVRALRQLGAIESPQPIGVRPPPSVPSSTQFDVRDSIELYESAHGRQHRWVPTDWVKTAAASTTRIFSPFSLDRGVKYQETLSANQLVTGQVAQFSRDTVQRFLAGSIGRVPNNTMPIELLDASAPQTR